MINIAPSLTTYNGQGAINPSLRVFEIDRSTNVPVNYFQYRLDIEKWNKLSNETLEFDLVYDFLSYYEVGNMSLKTVGDLAERLTRNKTLF